MSATESHPESSAAMIRIRSTTSDRSQTGYNIPVITSEILVPAAQPQVQLRPEAPAFPAPRDTSISPPGSLGPASSTASTTTVGTQASKD